MSDPLWNNSRSFSTACWAGEHHGRGAVAWHAHAENELVLVRKGNCRMDIEGDTLSGPTETVFYLPARLSQFQSSEKEVQTVYIGFQGTPPWQDPQKPRTWLLRRDEPCGEWLTHLSRLFTSDPQRWIPIADPLLQACLLRLRDLSSPVEKQWPSAIEKVIRTIESHGNEPLNVESLAKTCGLSSSHLRLLMRKHLGTNVLNYHHRLRIDKARRLLRDPYLRVKEIATLCGFEDTNYFCRLFKKHTGTSPSCWRKTKETS